MKRRRRNRSNLVWVTVRETNLDYASDRLGIPKAELKLALEAAKENGEFEVQLPIGTRIFTRRER